MTHEFVAPNNVPTSNLPDEYHPNDESKATVYSFPGGEIIATESDTEELDIGQIIAAANKKLHEGEMSVEDFIALKKELAREIGEKSRVKRQATLSRVCK